MVAGGEPELNMSAVAPNSKAVVEPSSLQGLGVADSTEGAESTAATKLQNVFRGNRTRRRLADSAVVAEMYWLQAIEYARLNYNTVSFFDHLKPEATISIWIRAGRNAYSVGQGLSEDDKALTLAFRHWIEAIDPRHRYGHNLQFYFKEWQNSKMGQPFFHWLDVRDGRDVDLKECPRSLLQKQCIIYLGPKERQHYQYELTEGKIVHKESGRPLDTTKESEKDKWIFVMSTSKKLYAGQKIKGHFHHSSFLAGGATLAAGRFYTENGVIKSIWDDSGHYRPSQENLKDFLAFLRSGGVDLDRVHVHNHRDEEKDDKELDQNRSLVDEIVEVEGRGSYKRTLSGGIRSPRAEVPKEVILERINSKKHKTSYQLGDQLSKEWCTGVGPRIGCVADYPLVLREAAMEFVYLSPRVTVTLPSTSGYSFSVSYMLLFIMILIMTLVAIQMQQFSYF